MNNPALDRLMLEASAAAYNVVLNPDGQTATLTGADPEGVAYTFDPSGIITSTGLLIVVGVVLDTMKQLQAQLVMRHYEGFIK